MASHADFELASAPTTTNGDAKAASSPKVTTHPVFEFLAI